MKTLAAIVVAASCLGIALAQSAPPGPPQYQMRAPAGSQNRLAPRQDGASVFSTHCGYCHLPFGMGTNLLTKQQVLAGQPPAMGLLANRRDLTAGYISAVVRNGKGAMPAQTRVDITDAELVAVGAYLTRDNAK